MPYLIFLLDGDLYLIARGTPGFSGADLSNLLNQAALRASQRKQANITLVDMEWAKDKILMGKCLCMYV